MDYSHTVIQSYSHTVIQSYSDARLSLSEGRRTIASPSTLVLTDSSGTGLSAGPGGIQRPWGPKNKSIASKIQCMTQKRDDDDDDDDDDYDSVEAASDDEFEGTQSLSQGSVVSTVTYSRPVVLSQFSRVTRPMATPDALKKKQMKKNKKQTNFGRDSFDSLEQGEDPSPPNRHRAIVHEDLALSNYRSKQLMEQERQAREQEEHAVLAAFTFKKYAGRRRRRQGGGGWVGGVGGGTEQSDPRWGQEESDIQTPPAGETPRGGPVSSIPMSPGLESTWEKQQMEQQRASLVHILQLSPERPLPVVDILSGAVTDKGFLTPAADKLVQRDPDSILAIQSELPVELNTRSIVTERGKNRGMVVVKDGPGRILYSKVNEGRGMGLSPRPPQPGEDTTFLAMEEDVLAMAGGEAHDPSIQVAIGSVSSLPMFSPSDLAISAAKSAELAAQSGHTFY